MIHHVANTDTGLFDDLDDGAFDKELTRPVKDDPSARTYPCQACNGSGRWVSPLGRKRGKCHACNGRGHFKTSPQQRRDNRAKAATKKKQKVNDFIKVHQTLITWLSENSSWNDFASSLVDQVHTRGSLTDNQLSAATRMMEKTLATHAKKDEERQQRADSAPVVDLTKINALFDVAKGNGLKRPILRVGQITLSVAPATGVNAGYLYVKDDGEYAGKLSQQGKFLAVRSTREGVAEELATIALNPAEVAKLHGKRTGHCACCGKELTKHESIDRGIGPICAGKWGF